MPLMVDDQSMMDNIDDLFGDGDNDGINAALAATLDSDMLRRRIEESHIIGCCRKLAWSRSGSVAHISQDGHNVSFRAFVREKATGKWSLTAEGEHSVQAKGDARFVHVEWSSSGSELVVIDQFGRLSIYAMGLALNRLLPNNLNYAVPQDDLGAVVGLHYLHLIMGTRVPIVSPAVKDGDRWQTAMQPYQYTTATHPLENKAAFLCVTRSNHLKLMAQQQSNPWTEATLELGELTSSNDIITHASFGDVMGQILLATYDTSKCLRLYRVNILWNPVQGDYQHGQPASVSPVLRVTHIQLLHRVLPQVPNGAELSQILIQSPMVGADRGHVLLTALFTCLPDDQQMGHQVHGRGSVIARWELRQSEVVLHDVFKTLKPGTDKLPASKARETLHRLSDVTTQKIYLSIGDNLYHHTLTCTSSDGTVDFRARDTMEVIMADGDSNKVSSLPQAGFTFMTSECTDISLSPSGCLGALVGQDGKVHLHAAEYVHGWKDAKSDHYLPQAAIVALARETGILVCHSLGTDDILHLIPTDLDRGLRRRLIAELLRTVSKNTDFSSEESSKDKTRVMKDSLLFKVMALQLILGYDTDPSKRDIPGKLAWAMLNLRSLCQNLASSMSVNLGPAAAEILISLRGQAKWVFDLMHHILNSLFSILRNLSAASSSSPPTRSAIIAELAKSNSLALHILLHSATRHLLRFLTEIVKVYIQRSIASKNQARDAGQRAGLQEIENLIHDKCAEGLAFKLPVFDQLLGEIDGLVRKSYGERGADARERSQIEQAMLVEGDVPEKLMPVVEALFRKEGLLERLAAERCDGVKIFMAETAWLGFGDEVETGKWRVDVIRKVRMLKGRKVRRCRRCGSYVEDVIEGGRLGWVMGGQRQCVCMSAWVL